MSAFIPLFPLGLVVYPGEELHLHIFEPRYKQLIHDCSVSQKPFGIPTILDRQVCEVGTLVRLREITTVHENGELDIITDGTEVFRIMGQLNLAEGKLYSGTLTDKPVNDRQGDRSLMREIIGAIKQLHATLKIKKHFAKPEAELWSYDVAHHAGLSLREEYQLLCLLAEREREEFLIRHLAKVLPIAREMESLRERVKLNGHFKPTSGFEW